MTDTGPRIPKLVMQRSRNLRRQSTVPERILWGLLRNRRLGGLRFRRQHPLPPYIVDFCCPEVLLIVELDGLSHVGQGESDDRRTAYLERLGYRVLRITNDDLLEVPEAVANHIARAAGLDW